MAKCPSGEKATHMTPVGCLKELSCFPVSTSHKRTVRSTLAERTCLPSGENATQVTSSVWPWKLRPLPVSMSQRRISPRVSPEPPPRLVPASTYFPSGEKATLHAPLEPVLY